MEILLVLVGIVIGFLIGMTLNAHSKYSSKTIEENYIQKSVYTEVMQDNKSKATEINDLTSQLSTIKEKSSNFEQKLEDHKSEFNEIKARMSLEFNQISTKIFEENSNKFLALNEKNVSAILNPLKEKILSFESKVDKNFLDETREKASLKKELEQIIQLNKQVSGFINTTNQENSFFLFNSFLNSMNDNILVLPCDIVIDIDLNKLMEDFLLLGEPAIMIVPTSVKSGIEGDFISYNLYNNCITKLDRSENTNIYASGLQVINLNKINKFKINYDNFSSLWKYLLENNELKVSNVHPIFWNCFDELDQLNKF